MRDGNPSCPYAGAYSPIHSIYDIYYIYDIYAPIPNFTRLFIFTQYQSSDLGLCCFNFIAV